VLTGRQLGITLWHYTGLIGIQWIRRFAERIAGIVTFRLKNTSLVEYSAFFKRRFPKADSLVSLRLSMHVEFYAAR
jgi:hypothetical protein